MDYFSSPKELKLKKLPTQLDVVRGFLFEKTKWMVKHQTEKEPEIAKIAEIVTDKIQKIYSSAGINTIRKDKIKERVQKTYKSRLALFKISRSKRHSNNFSKKKELYKSYLTNMFAVASSNATLRERTKVSKRYCTNNTTADIDHTNRKRSAALQSRLKTYSIAMHDENLVYDSSFDINSDNQNDADYEVSSFKTTTPFKRLDLSGIVELQSRFSPSYRCTSAIVNATLRTVNLLPAVDKSKLRRAQKRTFEEISNTPVDFAGGLYYDSRKDLSIFRKRKEVESGFKFYRSIKREEHYSLISEPGGLFLGFVRARKGTADIGSKEILSFAEKNEMLNRWIALGCDGTNTNVGSDGGINRFIEVALQRPVHWFVCLLHANEIPLKTLIIKLDGKTTGKNSFSGPIGKELENVCDFPIVNFTKLKFAKPLEKISDDVFRKLSSDQKYLYRIVNALISGNFPDSLQQMKIGPLNHSRWITTASRVCRFYAATRHPTKTLKIIASYIVNVYAPTWFQIKKNELAIDGPKNLFFLIQKSNSITDGTTRKIVQKCIRRNAFFAHSENVLLAQLSSKKKAERTDAVTNIINMRNRIPSGQIRRFKVPEVNFCAKSWTEIAVLNKSNLFEPPFTCNMNEDELLAIKQNPLNVPKFKCHTQMVERAVKEVTRVSLKVIDHEKRNAMVKATLLNRAKFPKFDSLQDHIIQNGDESIGYFPKI